MKSPLDTTFAEQFDHFLASCYPELGKKPEVRKVLHRCFDAGIYICDARSEAMAKLLKQPGGVELCGTEVVKHRNEINSMIQAVLGEAIATFAALSQTKTPAKSSPPADPTRN